MANVVPSSPILVTLMMEALSFSETLVLTRATQRSIPEDAILHSHCHENLKSYTEDECLLQVNCLEPHPQIPVLATSGLDDDVKIWVPSCEQEPTMAGLRSVSTQVTTTLPTLLSSLTVSYSPMISNVTSMVG
jgi:hypothetical protein